MAETEQRQDATKKDLIGPILFLYYEESLVSSNLNSNLLRFHCAHSNILAFIDLFSYSSLANTTDSLSASGLGTHRNWLQGLPDSPLIQPVSEGSEDSGQKELKLRFDVSQYSPEEIVVKTVDNKLLVRICSVDSFFIGSNNPNSLLLEFWYFLPFKKARKTRKSFMGNLEFGN